jgi:hypothetical protein
MFLIYKPGGSSAYLDYNSPTSRDNLNLNIIRNDPKPFPGRGMYSSRSEPLYDDGFLDPVSALRTPTQKDHLKFYPPESKKAEDEMRQNGTDNLPDHFSRYGYNASTGTCRNGYCLGNHNGRYIVGEEELGRGIYANPANMAPPSWYEKQKRLEQQEYWEP